ncbi:MAG TPA: heparan-alpha-glucosaminide N-acetyltransferase domain-containing protein [Gemmataceae bacterium]|nr:heparan-alpha-glucosaminide N-acetyltransferase domain-containing protein [Gemmataceae bacterium]
MTAPARPDRLDSVDLLRGAVIALMALDHVRDFFSDRLFDDPTDLNTTTPGIFVTRWVTHYCAPTFIFLAGTAAYLSRMRGKSRAELSWFLFTRGLWLAVMEITINRALWMFNYDLQHHGAGVFWAIGWSMVVLSMLIYLPTWAVTAFGVVMIASHNLLDGLFAEQVGLPRWLWVILHSPGDATVVDGYTFGTGYCLIPWMGVMAAGYGLGAVFRLDRPVRRRVLFQLGVAVSLAFIVLRAINVYGDPRPWSIQQSGPAWTALSIFNCTKYPPSLLYLLMTLGPAILALGLFDRPLGPLARPLITFGRVPLFFYLLHIPLIHGSAALLDYFRFGWSPLATGGPWEVSPNNVPATYGVSLPVVYLIWVGVLLVLYFPCRWFAAVKRRRRDAWLSYF